MIKKDYTVVRLFTTLFIWATFFYAIFKYLIPLGSIRCVFLKEGSYGWVEPLFHTLIWSKIWGRNSLTFLIFFICVVAICWPLGYALTSRIFFNHFKKDEKLFISLPVGFLSNSVVWTFLILWTKYFNLYLYCGISLLITFILYLLKPNNIVRNYEKVKFSRLLFPLIIIIYGFLVFNNIFKNTVVPFSWDAMTNSYLESIIKGERTYPLIYPYLDLKFSYIVNFPPAFEILVVLFSSLMPFIPLPTVQMGIIMCCFILMPLILFYIIVDIIKDDVFALFGSFLVYGRGFTWSIWQSNYPETLSILSAALFVLLLSRNLFYHSQTNGKISYFQLVVLGMIFSVSMLSHPKVFQVYLISYVLFILITYISVKSIHKYLLNILVFSFAGLSIVAAPWIFHMISSGITQCIHWQPVLNLWKNIGHWNTLVYMWFSIFGFFVSFFYVRRNKIVIFVLVYVLVAIFIIKHHWLLEVFSPDWFTYKSIQYNTISFGFEGGVNKLFTSNLHVPVEDLGVYGFVITSPILIAMLVKFIFTIFVKLLNYQLSKIFSVVLIILMIIVETYIPGGTSGLLSEQDYEVLLELKRKTRYNDTLLLNPWTSSSYPEGGWAAAVSERKTVFFRIEGHYLTWLKGRKGIEDDLEEIKWAYENIDRLKNKEIFKNCRITHIFCPTSVPDKLKKKYDKTFKNRIESILRNRRSVIYQIQD